MNKRYGMNNHWTYLLILLICLVSACSTTMDSPILMTEEEYLQLQSDIPEPGNSGVEGIYAKGTAVDTFGKLQVINTQLCDGNGVPVQLRGLFVRALKVESKFLNEDCFDTMVNDWKINVIRIPFMPASWFAEPSYINDEHYEQLIDKAIELSERFGIYCIIDWHILGDGNPFEHARESKDFFTRLAYKYGAKKHVIYEICNEPNGKEVTWDKVIKPYAELIVPSIKAGDPEALVLVGTSTWSQDVDIAADNPLDYANVMYTFHFYAGSHKEHLRARVEAASSRIPLFSSEWGSTNYDATGGPFTDESGKWLDLMEKKGISWCHYALTDFDEDAALLKPNAHASGEWNDNDLTDSGKFVVHYLKNRS